MRWISDPTGRFSQRPYYTLDELDSECEATISRFLVGKYGHTTFPIRTDDLTILIEQEVSDLDQFADLSVEGAGVEGATDFIAGRRPRVRIARLLQSPGQENRLRTTLTHELGHVRLHADLWNNLQPRLIPDVKSKPPRCNRDTILTARKTDWLEWQAGYASGAYLMPRTHVRQTIRDLTGESPRAIPFPYPCTAQSGRLLIDTVVARFAVSKEAARVRLLQLNYLTDRISPNKQISIL